LEIRNRLTSEEGMAMLAKETLEQAQKYAMDAVLASPTKQFEGGEQ